jgi:hypothetical protein
MVSPGQPTISTSPHGSSLTPSRALAGTFLSTLIYVEAAPSALATIKWRYYVIFICLTLINVVIVYFWCPETKGLSLEEINEKFGDDVATRFTDALPYTTGFAYNGSLYCEHDIGTEATITENNDGRNAGAIAEKSV